MAKKLNKSTFVSIHGGLGNQLFQLGLAEILSRESHVTLTHWRGNCRTDQKNVPWIHYYEAAKQFAEKQNRLDQILMFYARSCFKIASRSRKNYFSKWVFQKINFFLVFFPKLFQIGIITTPELGDFAKPKLLRRNYVFAYLQTVRASDALKKKLKVENSTHKNLLPIDFDLGKEILVVHIRRTDYLENPKIGALPKIYFHDALEHLAKIYSWDELWLFSDDINEALEMIPKKFNTKIRITSQGDENPVETLALMSYGKSFILSNSTFGWWSAILAHTTPAHVVVPKKWFREIPEPLGLIPPNWIRVDM